MQNWRLNNPERRWQSPFRMSGAAGALIIGVIVGICAWQWGHGPDRRPLPARTVALQFERVAIDPRDVAPLGLAGAWRLTADDPRFGGFSALFFDRGQLLALSDSAILARFSPPASAAEGVVTISELPDGPGSPLIKENRDSEALVADPLGRGWWVAFEQHHQIWFYDPAFRRGRRVVDFGRKRWPRNLGIEALLVEPGRILAIPEQGREVVELTSGRVSSLPLRSAGSRISDAARLATGEMVLLLRDVGFMGLRNALAVLVRDRAGWRVDRQVQLGLGRFDNMEGIAIQPTADGGVRLWLIADDNSQPPLTTLLVALDLPEGRWPVSAQSPGPR